MNVNPLSWKHLVNACAIVTLMALFSSSAFGQGNRLSVPFGPMTLVGEISRNAEGNFVWDIGIAGINDNAVAVELGFQGDFIDLPGPAGGTIDDSLVANDLFQLGLFDAPNDSHYRRAPANQRGGFDTENPGNNPFTGEVTTGWWQDSDDPSQIFISLGSSRNQDPVIPLIQLVTPSTDRPFFIVGGIAQNHGEMGDSFFGGGQLPPPPEPSTFLLSVLALVGMVAVRRRN